MVYRCDALLSFASLFGSLCWKLHGLFSFLNLLLSPILLQESHEPILALQRSLALRSLVFKYVMLARIWKHGNSLPYLAFARSGGAEY
jgi:hypothetical protein